MSVGERATKKSWFDALRVGDTVFWGEAETPRLIRGVTKDERGFLTHIDFAIIHCSWTGRAYTVYSRNDIKLYCKPSGLPTFTDLRKTKGQKLLEKAINQRAGEPFVLDCCDVKGWP